MLVATSCFTNHGMALVTGILAVTVPCKYHFPVFRCQVCTYKLVSRDSSNKAGHKKKKKGYNGDKTKSPLFLRAHSFHYKGTLLLLSPPSTPWAYWIKFFIAYHHSEILYPWKVELIYTENSFFFKFHFVFFFFASPTPFPLLLQVQRSFQASSICLFKKLT